MRELVLAALISAGVAKISDAATVDQNWDSRFVIAPGLDGHVSTLLTVGTNLYAGGEFATAGVPDTSGVARWDGTRWNSVGGGINGIVSTLATDGTNLYAGGSFITAGSAAATNIAKWDGSSWSSLGALFLPNSLNSSRATVHSLLWDQGLLAAGMFTQAGSTTATNVARWDGQTWHALGDGLGLFGPGNDVFQVFALAKYNNELYAGGLFHRSGGIAVTNLARWTGTNWAQVGGGVSGGSFGVYWFDETGATIISGAVYTLNANASGLLVGGDFTDLGGTIATNVARWNGTNWAAIGGYCDGAVNRIASDGPDQLALGSFTHVGGIAASGIAQWNGSSWSALGSGVIPAGLDAARVGLNLYVGGHFQIAGGQSAGHIARWDGTTWSPLLPGSTTGPSDYVANLVFGPDGSLYASGGFGTVGTLKANGVAKYNGTNWSSFGNGFPERNLGRVAILGTNLYVEGSFSRPSEGITNLARWNGSTWVALGNGLGNDGYSPIIGGFAAGTTNLFVAGHFTTAGGLPATNLASWDGSQWSAIPIPPSTFCASINTPIATAGDELFICQQGSCFFGDPNQVQIKKWDGAQWTDVGSPFSLTTVSANYPYIQSMICVGTNIFIAGHFAVTNGFLATNLVHWNGVVWSGVNHPFGADSMLAPLVHDGTNLFMAANSYGVSPTEIKLGKWDGARWKILGTGVTASRYGPQVSALAVRGRDLYVGGEFSNAGAKPANNLALWHDFPEVTLASRGWQPSGRFGLRILGGNGQAVRLQTSTNLQSWNDLGQQLPNSDFFDLEDPAAPTGATHFYRLLLLP